MTFDISAVRCRRSLTAAAALAASLLAATGGLGQTPWQPLTNKETGVTILMPLGATFKVTRFPHEQPDIGAVQADAEVSDAASRYDYLAQTFHVRQVPAEDAKTVASGHGRLQQMANLRMLQLLNPPFDNPLEPNPPDGRSRTSLLYQVERISMEVGKSHLPVTPSTTRRFTGAGVSGYETAPATPEQSTSVYESDPAGATLTTRKFTQAGMGAYEVVLTDRRQGKNIYAKWRLLTNRTGYFIQIACEQEATPENLARAQKFFDSLTISGGDSGSGDVAAKAVSAP